jgi:hypothetical protein
VTLSNKKANCREETHKVKWRAKIVKRAFYFMIRAMPYDTHSTRDVLSRAAAGVDA